MAIPSFFKQNKPRGFNYMPRYYDPAKEELEQRLKAWSKESSSDEAPDSVRRSGLRPAESEDGASSARAPDSDRRSGLRPAEPEGGASFAEATEGGANQPYRSKIMRGDMRNHFRRRKERVERHTTIRLLVIIIIIVLVVYLYLRF